MSSKSSTTAPQKPAKSVEPPAAHVVPAIATPEGIAQALATNAMVASVPFNENKLRDSGDDTARNPPVGQTAVSVAPVATGSTLTENVESLKVGGGIAPDGINANDGSLDRVRVDSSGQPLTTNQGVPIGDNQSSLKAGLRGPTLLEDFILREKITHFDHERIPERVVHARGSGAHGYFEPYNSLGGGCPFQAGAKGFVSFPERISEDKVRGKPEKFAEHYSQATLFFDSQTPAEQAHITAAFRFELSKVTVPAIRERMLASLANVSDALAAEVALGLGIPVPTPMPRAVDKQPAEVASSPALSLTALPGERGISTRRVAIILAEGFDFELVHTAREALTRVGATSRLLATRLGVLKASNGKTLNIEATFENSPSVLFDAMIAPDVVDNAAFFAQAQVAEFIQTQFRHCKTIAVGEPSLLRAMGIPAADDKPPAGIINLKAPKAVDDFLTAVAQHRHFSRETDPPLV